MAWGRPTWLVATRWRSLPPEYIIPSETTSPYTRMPDNFHIRPLATLTVVDCEDAKYLCADMLWDGRKPTDPDVWTGQ